MFDLTTQTKNIPTDAFQCQFDAAECSFADGGDQQKRRFRIKLYDGKVKKHWYWGNLAFDLAGMRLAKKQVPLLYAHDTDRRIGVTDRAAFDGALVLEGVALDNDAARQVLADADAGFPFEGSLQFDPYASEFRFVKENETAVVNGHKLTGPGTVFTKTVIREGSVCVFGALSGCKTDAFDHQTNHHQNSLEERDRPMLTINELKESSPDVYNAVLAEGRTAGETAAAERFAAIAKACGDDAALACECFAAGKTDAEALAARNDKLTAALAAERQKLADLAAKPAAGSTQAAAPTAPPTAPDKADIEFADDVNNGAAATAGQRAASPAAAQPDYVAMTDEQLKAAFAADASLRQQFTTETGFIKVVRSVANGSLKIRGL